MPMASPSGTTAPPPTISSAAATSNSAQELLREGDQIIANTGRQSRPGILNLVVTRVDDSGVAVARS